MLMTMIIMTLTMMIKKLEILMKPSRNPLIVKPNYSIT